MTTCVKVTACCDDETEVHIGAIGNGEDAQTIVLQHGETTELYVHGDRKVTVEEVAK